MYTTI